MDFEKIDPHLYSENPQLAEGSKHHLKELVDALHQEGIKLILDMVVNHTGYHNDNYRNHHSEHIRDDWFNVGQTGEKKGELAGLPDLNHSKPDVVDYFVNNILSWIEEACIDAIRMDTVKHVEDAFWYFFKSYVKGKYRNITLIGEVLNFDVHSISKYQREHDFDTLFDFPLTVKIKETFVHNGSMEALARPRISDNEPRGILDMDKFYTNANRLVTLLDNHDLDKRFMTEILDRWGHWDRMRAVKIFKLALTFLFTTRGIPQLYYGTEIGMEGRRDPDNRRDMPWELFDQELVPKPGHADEREIFLHTQKLIQIRKQNQAIQHGYLFTLFSDHFIYAYMREYKGNVIIVLINNGLEDMPFPLRISIDINGNIPIRIKENLRDKTLTNLLDKNDKIPVSEGSIQVKLTGKEGKIYSLAG
jgi:glycosidase